MFRSKASSKAELKPISLEESKVGERHKHERENSSCKNTVKMTDRRDFSFVE